MHLPPRIWVVGPCGAGKSTLAGRLAAHLGVAATHLDELHWLPGWVEREQADTAARLAAVLDGPRWVIDGNYERLRGPRRASIDLYVWLDLPLSVTWPRLVRRCLRRAIRKEPCCNGNRESLLGTFFDPESLLYYSVATDRRRRENLVRETRGRPCVRLRTQRAIDRWVAKALALPPATS
jgi:adenylate kinase family enzyme